MSSPTYECLSATDPSCPTACVGLESCQDCGCAVVDTDGGPWGDALDVIFCLLPIVFLLVATLKPNPLPTTQSLPLASVIMFLVRLMYLGSDPLLVCASVVTGLFEAITPLTIMGGAILLFDTMEATLCMPYMMREMKLLTKGHHVAELCLLFAFAYMVEGASGFGTPVALGAPMLVSLGYPKLEAVVTLLLMNTFATVWGAVGTPIWFGFGNLELTEDDFREISYKASIALAVSAFLLLPTMVLSITCSKAVLWQNKVFLFLALGSCILPNVGLSFVSYEFPSLIGGMVGVGVTAVLIHFHVGMAKVEHVEEVSGRHPLDMKKEKKRADEFGEETANNVETSETKAMEIGGGKGFVEDVDDEEEKKDDAIGVGESIGANEEVLAQVDKDDEFNDTKADALDLEDGTDFESDRDSHRAVELHLGPRKKVGEGYIKELLLRTFPLTGSVVLLIVTRVPSIGLRDVLTDKEPNFSIYFGTFGTFRCSASLVLQLENILTYPNLNWKYELLYIPFIMPFAIVSFTTMFIFRKDLQHTPREIVGAVVDRLKKPAIALLGALVLVQLLIKEGPAAPATIIGTVLSDALKEGWIAVASSIGALGSFFSGSTTVSNLTFGGVQQIAAEDMGTSTTAMLALQAAGASAGNGICLNNIIAACAVVGLDVGEGKIIARTWKMVSLFCVIATVVMLAVFFRF